MIAVDSSTWIAYLEGEGGDDAQTLDRALDNRQVLMVGASKCWQSAVTRVWAMP